MGRNFKNPPDSSDNESVDLIDHQIEDEEIVSDHSLNAEDFDDSSDISIDDSDDENYEQGASGSGVRAPVDSDGEAAGVDNLNADEEDDETIKAIIAAIKKPRTVPPEIELDEFITDISFHPNQDIIAAGLITGDIQLIKYANEGNEVYKTMEVHTKACRDLEFSDDGRFLISGSKDLSIMITDIETEKLKKFYEEAHTDTINKLYVLDENVFFSADDSGFLKMWDMRTKDPVFSLHEVEDQITSIITNEAQKLLIFTSADGFLTSVNIGQRKMYIQSEPYPEELTCMGMFRGDSKLAVGTSKGRIYTFNWGQFGYHCDMFPGLKIPVNLMVPITDRISALAGEDGNIRATHIAPFRNLGIIGQHNLPVEAMDINHSGELIATTTSHNNDIRFWNIKYFEDFGDIKYNEKHNTYKERMHNLPSSKYTNASDFFSDLAKED